MKLVSIIGIFCLLAVSAARLPRPRAEVTVNYHVWYDTLESAYNAKSLKVGIEDQSTFFEVMTKAASMNAEHYEFEYEEFPFGRYITSIGGVKEDPDRGQYWMIYKLESEADPENPPTDEQLTPVGVDGIQISNGEYYLFWRTVPAIPETKRGKGNLRPLV